MRWKVPPGMWEQAHAEAQRIISQSWLPPAKERPRLRDDGSRSHLRLEGLSASSLIEIAARARVAEDLEWVLGEGRCTDFASYETLLKTFLLKANLPAHVPLHVRTDARGSKLYHEGALKERLEAALVSSGLPLRTDSSTTGSVLFARLEKDRLTLSISLCDQRLAQRGYKASLHAPAPLREELAAGCWEMLRAAVPEAFGSHASVGIWSPFAGSGTFGFEGVAALTDATPGLRARTGTMPCVHFSWWSPPTWDFLVKKSERAFQETVVPVSFLERNTEASAALRANCLSFLKAAGVLASEETSRVAVSTDDYFNDALSVCHFPTQWTLVAVNPPYGMRLSHRPDAANAPLAPRIARRLLALADALARMGSAPRALAGVLLCSSADEWTSTVKVLSPQRVRATHHFTQGGLEIRAVVFCLRAFHLVPGDACHPA